MAPSKHTETPPLSQALQRRLIVDRKQCVYSDLPKRSGWGSDGDTLSKKSSQTKPLTTSRSQDKVVTTKKDFSESSSAAISITDTSPQNHSKSNQAPRRQSIQVIIPRDSPLRKGPFKRFWNLLQSLYFNTSSLSVATNVTINNVC